MDNEICENEFIGLLAADRIINNARDLFYDKAGSVTFQYRGPPHYDYELVVCDIIWYSPLKICITPGSYLVTLLHMPTRAGIDPFIIKTLVPK